MSTKNLTIETCFSTFKCIPNIYTTAIKEVDMTYSTYFTFKRCKSITTRPTNCEYMTEETFPSKKLIFFSFVCFNFDKSNKLWIFKNITIGVTRVKIHVIDSEMIVKM